MRMLHVTSLPAGQTSSIEAFLETASEWVERAYRRNWSSTGPQVEDFYNVRQGEIINLQDEDPVTPVVTVFVTDNTNLATGRTLTEGTSYQLMSRGRVQLFFFPTDISGFHGGGAIERLPITYKTVRVAYTASNIVPKPVRDATALIAAASYRQSATEISGFRREKMGDYEYERANPSEDSFGALVIPSRARAFLAPYSGKRGVRST